MAGSPGDGFAFEEEGERSTTLSRQELDVEKVRLKAPELQGSPAVTGPVRCVLAEGPLFLSSRAFSSNFIRVQVFELPRWIWRRCSQKVDRDVETGGNGMGENEPVGPGDRRPTPVRVVMEASEQEEEGKSAGVRELKDPRSGEDWVAKVSGRSTSGVLPLRMIPLMEVGFAKAARPDLPLRRALIQGASLEELDDEELLKLLWVSGPFNSPSPEPSPHARGDRREKRRRRS
jgi:hypothetical protein